MKDAHLPLLLTAGLLFGAIAPARAETRSIEQLALALPPPPRTGYDSELHCLALNVYWEGRGESAQGQAAIAHVTLNRVADARFPKSVCQVVHQGGRGRPCQFSWWCGQKNHAPADGAAWTMALDVARRAMADPGDDPTGGALYFHEKDRTPHWAKRKAGGGRVIGHHVYFRLRS